MKIMTFEQKIFSKLEPHAKRIKDGEGNDFDYLPAVLLQVMEGQQRQIKLTDDTAKLLTSIENTVIAIGAQSKVQISAFESAVQGKMEQMGSAINNTQAELQSTQIALCKQIAEFASAHTANAIQTNESLGVIGLKIETLIDSIQRSHIKCMQLLIAGLVASTIIIGLVVVILQRH